jgi:hypothetical protein
VRFLGGGNPAVVHLHRADMNSVVDVSGSTCCMAISALGSFILVDTDNDADVSNIQRRHYTT